MDGVFTVKTRIILWLSLVFAAAFVLFGAENLWMQRNIASKTVRLHVVANSDSDEDQAHKLLVRDRVLEFVQELTATCKTAKEAKTVIRTQLPEIANYAAQISSYDIRVSLGTEEFETRYYDSFTLPAGQYPALRVNIGNAQGKNWWCVVFPSLCTAATGTAVEECASVGGFDEAETSLITGGQEKYKLRFKTLEWMRKLRNIFS